MTTTVAAQTAQTGTGSSAIAVATISVPAGSLESGILALGRQTNLRLLYPSALTAGKQTGGVNGQMSPSDAIAQLLVGTGLSFSLSGKTAHIFDPNASGNNAAATIDGAVALDTIDVSGGESGEERAADAPYQTPGSVSHISRTDIDRAPPMSPGDIFDSTPGVINAGNRVGTSINPNIRGLQGMGRISTTVDGARETTSSYRGYIGNRDETYIDPDLIGGVDIDKGPSTGVGVGGIGGSVAIRTLLPEDIVKDGHTWGARVKGSLGNNTAPAPEAYTPPDDDRPAFFGGDTWSGSVALATIQENFEAVAAFAKHEQGNYFVGTNVPKGVVFPPGIDVNGDGRITGKPYGPDLPANSPILPGAEALNTSESTESALIKGKVKWGDGQSLQLGYVLYTGTSGEVSELLFAPWFKQNQYPLATTRVDTYTANYKWNPSNSSFINARANLWYSDVAVDRVERVPYATDTDAGTIGGDVGNTAAFATTLGKLSVDTGFEFVHEKATAPQKFSFGSWTSYGPSGTRLLTGTWANATLDLTHWLSVSGGGRFDYYESEGAGYLADYPKRSGSKVSPNAGVTVTPIDGLQIFALYKEGYRPPSLRESHWDFGSLLGNNPNLRPELSTNYEAGFNILRNNVFQDGDKVRFKASYFINQYDDYIVRAPAVSGNARYQFTNIDRANYSGFELSGSYDAGLYFAQAAFTKYDNVEYCVAGKPCFVPATAGFSGSTDSLKNDYVTNYIPPEYSGSVTAGVRLFDEALTLGGRATFASTRFGTTWGETAGMTGQVGYQFTWPSYTVFDVFGSYKLNEDTLLNASVENITDEYYFGALSSIGIPSPGRTAWVSLTRQF